MIIFAIFIVLLNIYTLIKHRKNKQFTLLFLVIFYFNYSICVGEYFLISLHEPLYAGLRWHNDRNYFDYGIIILFIFNLLLCFIPVVKERERFKFESNNYVLIFLLGLLGYIFLFGIDRSPLTESYEVRITPIYEYSYIIFIFAAKYSNTSFKKTLIVLVAALFVLQDAFFGGRVTSMQIGLVLLCTLFYNSLNFKRIILIFFAGIIGLSIVAIYRNTFSLEAVTSYNLFRSLNFFVNDTATYAYGASLASVVAFDFTTFEDRLVSFIYFIQSIFTGGALRETLFRDAITSIPVHTTNYYIHLGGTLFPFYFFFWFGWIGPFIAGIVASKYISFWSKPKRGLLGQMIFLSIIVTVPRWYLYTPLVMFRGSLVFIPIVFICVKMIVYFTTKKKPHLSP